MADELEKGFEKTYDRKKQKWKKKVKGLVTVMED